MKALEQLIRVSSVPIIFCDLIGCIGSVIWLMVLGEWGILGYGLLAMIISSFLISFALIPGLLLAVPAMSFLEKDNKLGGYFFGFLGSIYTISVMSAWCILVLLFFLNKADSSSYIPVLLWSYCVATGAIAYLAQKDSQSGNDSSAIPTFFLKIAYILTMLGILLVGMSIQSVVVLFMLVMTVSLVIQFYVTYLEEKHYRY